MTTIAAIIVTHNRCAMLTDTLRRTLEEPYDVVFVVDNESDDDTPKVLSACNDPRLRVIRLTENTGGAGGFECGVKAALEAGLDWAVLFDDDACARPGCIARFRDISVADDVGAIAAVVERPDQSISEMNRPGINPLRDPRALLRTLTGQTEDRNGQAGFRVSNAALHSDAVPSDIDMTTFVGFFLRLSCARKIGPPDGNLFIYGDDILYSLQLRKSGFRIALHPALRFVHHTQIAAGHLSYDPVWKVYYHCRNGVRIAYHIAGPLLFVPAYTYYLFVCFARGRHLPPSDRKRFIRLMRQGIFDGLRGRFGRKDALHNHVSKP